MILFHHFIAGRPAWRYVGLSVGLDSASPWDADPAWLQYDALCGRYHGPSPTPPVNISIPCTAVATADSHRYVIVQSGRASPAALCLAQVQVIVNGRHSCVTICRVALRKRLIE